MAMTVYERTIKFGEDIKKSVRPFRGKVTAVESDLQTCTVAPLDGDAECHLVALKPAADGTKTGVIPVPVVGSIVVCATLDSGQSWFVIQCSQVSRYIINAPTSTIELTGDQYSMVKGEVLQAELNKTKAVVDMIVQVLSGVPITEPGNGNPSALQAALQGALSTLTTGDYSTMLNDKVKHG